MPPLTGDCTLMRYGPGDGKKTTIKRRSFATLAGDFNCGEIKWENNKVGEKK